MSSSSSSPSSTFSPSHHLPAHFSSNSSARLSSFFTPYRLDCALAKSRTRKRFPITRFLRSLASIEPLLSNFIFAPGVRTRLTNIVFFAAFSSACLCVGARSLFPNYGFHSNSQAGKLKRSQQETSDTAQTLSTLATINHQRGESNMSSQCCPLDLFQSKPVSEHSHSRSRRDRKQRRWLEEEAP